jgi:hypothetical protein
MASLLERGLLTGGDGRFRPEEADADRLSAPGGDVDYSLTGEGAAWLEEFGIDLAAIRARRRALIRYCMDWSEQRHHLAGALGAALAGRLFALGWLAPSRTGRAVTITDVGGDALRTTFAIDLGD